MVRIELCFLFSSPHFFKYIQCNFVILLILLIFDINIHNIISNNSASRTHIHFHIHMQFIERLGELARAVALQFGLVLLVFR